MLQSLHHLIPTEGGGEAEAEISFKTEIPSTGAALPEAPPRIGLASSSAGSTPLNSEMPDGGIGIEGISLSDSSWTPSGRAFSDEGGIKSMAS